MKSTTFVSAFFQPATSYRSDTDYFDLFDRLASTGVSILLFLDTHYSDKVFPSNVRVIPTSLDTSFLPESPVLPSQMHPVKDSAHYMCIQLNKLRVMKEALVYVDTPYLAWIDFGAFHMVKHVTRVTEILRTLETTSFRTDRIISPGSATYTLSDVWTRPVWRLFGTFWVGHRSLIASAYERQMTLVHANLPRITWEVNYWAMMDDMFHVYPADHDDSIFTNLPIPKTTLVTSYFDISKLEDASPSVRSIDFYKDHAIPLLEIDAPMVVFCDTNTHLMIKTIRGIRPTTYIVKSIQDYDLYSHLYPIVKRNYKSLNPRTSPSYFLVTTFKYIALYLASLKNPYQTGHFAWVDFGGSHILKEFHRIIDIINSPHPKIAVTYIHYRDPKQLIHNLETKICDPSTCIASTCITAEASYIPNLYLSILEQCSKQVIRGIAHADEQLLNYVFVDHPEWFTVRFGDYTSILQNYFKVITSHEAIHSYFITNALSTNKALALQAIRECGKFTLTFPNDQNVRVAFPTLDDECVKFPYKEPGFRSIVSHFISTGVIDRSRDILDVGAWKGDNAIPWSMQIDGHVYAIDPSQENCQYIDTIARFNSLENCFSVRTAISDRVETLYTNGHIDHCSFHYNAFNNYIPLSQGEGHTQTTATTLDILFSTEKIGFIHLDVEGMEYKAICGALELIKRCRPVVAYEVHTTIDERVDDIARLFISLNYEVRMIDEVLENCRPDCRNCIAIPSETPFTTNGIPLVPAYKSLYGRDKLSNAVQWHKDCVTAKVLHDNFHHFIQLYDAVGREHIHGWGSYLFNGLEYSYQLETLKKQEALFRVGQKVSHLLEIGVYLGHSLLILLLSNPTLRITCIDNDARYSPKAVEYLNQHFGNRITFHLGDATEVLKTLPYHEYDAIHIDADHTQEAVRSHFLHSLPLAKKNAYIVFDDYEATQSLIDQFVFDKTLSVIELPRCLWTNIVTQLNV